MNNNTFNVEIKHLNDEQKEALAEIFILKAAEKGIEIEYAGEIVENVESFKLTQPFINRDVGTSPVLSSGDMHKALEAAFKESLKTVSTKHQIEPDPYGQVLIQDAISHEL